MNSMRRAWCLLLILAGFPALASDPFPVPAGLEPDVAFWVSIFTGYSTHQGVLHDSRRLDVVYEHIEFGDVTDRRARQRQITERRNRLEAALKRLASGRRDGLNEDETRALAAWPADVTNEELAQAAGRIRYQQGLSDRFREGLVRAGRWRTFIEAEFQRLGVPVELAALPHVESSYNPDARSHVGASGIWQFTQSTGRRFMRVDHVVDERNDPFFATVAAGRLLAYNYSITGNWPMAVTAYNHGLAGVRRAMQKHGDTAYADILRNYDGRTFGFASRNFYVAFLAAKQVDQDAQRYFPGIVPEAPTDYVEFSVESYVPAGELASALGITAHQLATYNPALQSTVWQGSKYVPRGYTVRIPSVLLAAPAETLLARVPAESWRDDQLPDLFHTVARGDTLSEIAAAYGTRVSTLVALNNLGSSNRIRAGERLRLPAAGPAPAVVAEPLPEPAAVAVVDTMVAAAEPDAEPVIEPVLEIVSETAAETEPEVELVAEQTPAALSGETVADVAGDVPELQTALLSDPSDYGVAEDGSIEIQPQETLGHYADWLEIRTQRLRDINGLAFRQQVDVGDRIRLDLGQVDAAVFESRRVAYHRAQQDSFFGTHVISGFTEHVIARGESIWVLSLREYGVPIWLFRQYNPELDLANVRPGMTVRFPVMTARSEA